MFCHHYVTLDVNLTVKYRLIPFYNTKLINLFLPAAGTITTVQHKLFKVQEAQEHIQSVIQSSLGR